LKVTNDALWAANPEPDDAGPEMAARRAWRGPKTPFQFPPISDTFLPTAARQHEHVVRFDDVKTGKLQEFKSLTDQIGGAVLNQVHSTIGEIQDQADPRYGKKLTFQAIHLQFFVMDIVTTSLGKPKTGFRIS
jgi:hypothetical protein